MWNFQWSWFLALEFSRDLLQFCRISRGGALLYLDFPGVKNKISQWYVLNAPVCFFFWNSPTNSMFDPRNLITSSTRINITVYFLYIQNNLIFQNNFKRNITYQKLKILKVYDYAIIQWFNQVEFNHRKRDPSMRL